MPLPLWLKKFCIRTGIAPLLPITKRLVRSDRRSLRYYSDRVLSAPILEMGDSAAFPGLVPSDVIHLNLPSPLTGSAMSNSQQFTERHPTPPPSGTAELREVIAEMYQRRSNLMYKPYEQIFVTHGATAAYAAILDAFVNAGDRVTLFDPCSPMFSTGAISRRATIRWVKTDRTVFSSTELSRCMSVSKMLVVANPGNPNGNVLTREDWKLIAALARRYDVLVCVDESFEFYQYQQDVIDPITAAPDLEPRLIRIGSVSQTHGMGSLRVGWVAGPQSLVQAIGLCANLNAPYVPTLCQAKAVDLLAKPESAMRPVIERFRQRRQYTLDRLRGMGFEATEPDGGYYFWVTLTGLGLTGREFATRLMADECVLVGSGDVYGPSGKECIRISFAQEEGRLREGLSRMQSFVKRLREINTEIIQRDNTIHESMEPATAIVN